MFCPKCGGQNPETGKFCRSCGTDLGNITGALAAQPRLPRPVTSKGRPINLEGAITKIFSGFAFLAVAIVLGFTGVAGAKVWWFWMLIPAFGALGSGVAQFIQLRKFEKTNAAFGPGDTGNIFPAATTTALPPQQPQFVEPDSRYKTGDLVPPSVTDSTTRHLEMDSEGKTMTLPKK